MWPLQRILKKSYSVLTKVFSAMRKDSGFTKMTKSEILRRITDITKSWRGPNALPRVLNFLANGDIVHLSPYWMMEFRDLKGVRRFFRLEDQLTS